MAGVIPEFTSQESTRVGGIDVYANADQFGAGAGRALEQFGRQLTSISGTLSEKEKQTQARDRQAKLAVDVADTSISFAKTNQDVQLTAPSDGQGTMDSVLLKQKELIHNKAATIKDPLQRQAYETEMYGRLVPYAQNNVAFQAERSAKHLEDTTNFSLNGLENLARSDSTQYDNAVKDGHSIINGQQVPQGMKDTMNLAWEQKVANARFQGLMGAAKTPADFDAIAADLNAKDSKWQKVFDPAQFNSTLDELGRAKKAFVTQADVTARASLDSIEARTKDLVAVDPAEMSQVTDQATQSTNPITMKRAFAVQRAQQIIQDHGKLPSTELQARSNKLIQGGYPNLPNELNTAIQGAVHTFPGVSSSFLGGLSVQEYGKYLPSGNQRKGDTAYSPQVVGVHVDFRNVKPAAMNAIALAGEIYGKGLPIVSAERSQARQDMIRFGRGDPNRMSVAKFSHHTAGDAFDISTAGMSGADKGKLVDALLQAGFTGFGEYPTHIHADMRAKTPDTFNAKTGFLGWSKGSPEVVQALTSRGYGAGMDGGAINRGDFAKGKQPVVDYTRGTDSGSTTATGVNQWTNSSFLSIVKNPALAQRIGIPSGMSDAQLLELRKDPKFSLMATAAYAEQNQKTLAPILGHQLSDPELYMAHFLGPGGAQTFISAYANNPNAIASQLMPEAAKNNPGRFFDGKGKPYTVKEAYDNIAVSFSTAPNQVQYEDAKTYENMAKSAKTAETTDPMQQYGSHVAPNNDLSAPGGYASRGATASAAAGLYKIPIDEMKPFTAGESADLTKQLSEGNAQQKLAIMQNLATMDQAAPGMGKAAMAQLGVKDTVFAQAAYLANERGDTTTAETILRGADRLKNDKTFGETLFSKDSNVVQVFNDTTGGALYAIPPESRNAILEAAKALYAERSAQQGSSTFDNAGFQAAVTQVVGGGNGAPGLADVNGEPTVLPPGIDGGTFNVAIDNMSDADLVQFSETGAPPINIEGDPIPAEDISREGTFVYVGGTQYKIRMNDNNFLTTGERDANNYVRAYIFDAKPADIKALATRPVVRNVPPPASVSAATPAPAGLPVSGLGSVQPGFVQ